MALALFELCCAAYTDREMDGTEVFGISAILEMQFADPELRGLNMSWSSPYSRGGELNNSYRHTLYRRPLWYIHAQL